MKKFAAAAVGLVLAAIVVAVAWFALRREPASVALVSPPPAPAPVTTVPAPAPASAPAIRHPIDVPAAAASAPESGAAGGIEALLAGLFGRKSALGLFQFDDFERRVVVTVDNLGRSHAPPRLWPMNPAPERFLVERQGDGEVIAADNGLRYTPYVLLLETVDLNQVAAAYARLYPRFQKAYEEAGYPKGYFNDRLVDVLDQLVATPDVAGPIRVRLPVINGPVQPQRPWVLYEFEDPALQALSAGQKILLRTGPVNARRLKARLAELRRLLATGAPRQ